MCYLFRYKCINKEDGIAVKKDDNNNNDDDNGTMEGSDSRDQSYECNGDGEYTVPIDTLSGLPKFPSCIPRSKNFFSVANTSLFLHKYAYFFRL